MEKNKVQCRACKTFFLNESNLRRHVKRFHNEKFDQLAPFRYKKPENYNYKCHICGKNFSKLKNKTYHLKRAHNVSTPTVAQRVSYKCPLCSFNSEKDVLLKHFKEAHYIEVKETNMEVASANFQDWKDHLEWSTSSKFVLQYKRTTKKEIATKSYVCHRSGQYVPEGTGERLLKKIGSCKLNAFCPASIKVCFEKDIAKVCYVETHVGHEADLEYLTLTPTERRSIAEKIAAKVPWDEIIKEIKKTASTSTLQRIHLLKKKDLYNIERSFNLSPPGSRRSKDTNTEEVCDNDIPEEMSVAERKERITEQFLSKINNINSLSKLDELERLLSSISPE